MDSVLTYLVLAGHLVLVVLGATVAVLLLVAPLTKTDADNKLLAKVQTVLKFVESVLGKLLPAKKTV